MKRLLFFLPYLLLLSIPTLFGQINQAHNAIRCGDKLVKQQVQYIEPGKTGKGILWDCSTLKIVNDEYTLNYTSAPLLNDSLYIMGYNTFDKNNKNTQSDHLIVATEHNTMYYYQLKNDSLLLLGHENPVVKLQYTTPYLQMTYPFNYGQTINTTYTTQGLYSSTEPIQTKGMITITADAYGKMILPTGDTINPVLRITTLQTIEDNITPTNTIKQLETYRWYTKGYRYPIFETIKNINTENNEILFATSFYYPPQEHLYIDSDPENQKILDDMWKQTKDNNTINPNNKQEKTINQIITYNTYPNPVENILYVDYSLTEQVSITTSIYSTVDGKIYHSSKKQQKQAGTYHETINCHMMPFGTYILQILIDNQLPITNTIIKK